MGEERKAGVEVRVRAGGEEAKDAAHCVKAQGLRLKAQFTVITSTRSHPCLGRILHHHRKSLPVLSLFKVRLAVERDPGVARNFTVGQAGFEARAKVEHEWDASAPEEVIAHERAAQAQAQGRMPLEEGCGVGQPAQRRWSQPHIVRGRGQARQGLGQGGREGCGQSPREGAHLRP